MTGISATKLPYLYPIFAQMKYYLFLLLCLTVFSAQCQDSLDIGKVISSAYMETYFGQDEFGTLRTDRPDFLYNHTRINHAAINLAFLKASYRVDHFRMNMAFMAGTYAAKNMASEEPIFRNLFEANFGVALDKNKRIWIDAGVMPSHIGIESAVGWENATLTRCFVSENSPYYESGVKLSWKSKSEKWFAAILGLNGWQRISVDGGILPGGGTQLTFDNGKLKVNHSTFAGDVSLEKRYLLRIYQNLYATYNWSERFSMNAGFDLGLQQTVQDGSIWRNWYTWFSLLRYALNDRVSFAIRAEQFVDPDELLVSVAGFETGTDLYGFSLNGDYKFNKHLMLRMEVKRIGSSNENMIDMDRAADVRNYYGFTFSVCVGF